MITDDELEIASKKVAIFMMAHGWNGADAADILGFVLANLIFYCAADKADAIGSANKVHQAIVSTLMRTYIEDGPERPH